MQLQSKVTSGSDSFEKALISGVKKGLRSAAKKLQQDIRSLAPSETGKYRNSIEIDESGLADKNPSIAIGSDMTVDGYSLAELLEFGTRETAPQPHFRPAFQKNKGRLVKEIAKGFKK